MGLPAGELVEVDGLSLTGEPRPGKARLRRSALAVLVQAIIQNMG